VIPRLADQHPEHLVRQLVSFQNEQRGEPNAASMHAVTSGMMLDQIIAVSVWASRLGALSSKISLTESVTFPQSIANDPRGFQSWANATSSADNYGFDFAR
jgi:cytochrome c553